MKFFILFLMLYSSFAFSINDKEETVLILSECKKFKNNNFKFTSNTPTHFYAVGSCLSSVETAKELLALNCLAYLRGDYKGVFKADTTERLTGRAPSTTDVLAKVFDFIVNEDEEYFNTPFRNIIQTAIIYKYPCKK